MTEYYEKITWDELGQQIDGGINRLTELLPTRLEKLQCQQAAFEELQAQHAGGADQVPFAKRIPLICAEDAYNDVVKQLQGLNALRSGLHEIKKANTEAGIDGAYIPVHIQLESDHATCLTVEEQRRRAYIHRAQLVRKSQLDADGQETASREWLADQTPLTVLKDYLSFSLNGKQLLRRADESGVNIRLFRYKDSNALPAGSRTNAYHQVDANEIGVMYAPDIRQVSTNAIDLAHEMHHAVIRQDMGDLINKSDERSGLLRSKIEEAVVYAVETRVWGEVHDGLFAAQNKPRVLSDYMKTSEAAHQYGETWSDASCFFAFLANTLVTRGSRFYEGIHMPEYAELEARGKWQETVETFPLLQPDVLSKLATLPDGRCFLPKRMAKLVPSVVAQVNFERFDTDAPKPQHVGGFILSEARTPYRHRFSRRDAPDAKP